MAQVTEMVITSVEMAHKWLNISSRFFYASAWLDGYNGEDRSHFYSSKLERREYDHWWLLGSEFKSK